MGAIKELGRASDKWVRRSSVAMPDYTAGIESPKRAWSEASKAGKTNWQTGVTAAAGRDAYAKGVEKAGDGKWQAMAKQKGPTRFAEGVTIAKDEWSKGFNPYHSAYGALKLPDRGPRGSVANYERSKAVGTAFRAVKEKA